MAQPYEGGKSPDFHISRRWHKFYQSFCSRGKVVGVSYPLFEKYTNLYTLCAAIGHNLGKRTKLDSSIETPFTLEQIDENSEWPVLTAIAWSGSGHNMKIFENSREIIEICDEYAETGIQELAKKYPFSEAFKDNVLLNAEKFDLEINTAQLVAEYRESFSPMG